MADAFNNPTSHADVIPEIWRTTSILAATDHTNNALLTVSSNASALLPMGGDIINFPKQSAVTLGTVSQTAVADTVQASMTTIQLTINTHKGAPLLVTSQADALSNQDIMMGLAAQAGAAAGKAIDASLAALRSSAGLTVTGNTSLNITEAQIAEAEQKMDEANAPRQGRWLVLNPQQMAAMGLIARFTEAQTIGSGQNIMLGGVRGTIHGFDVLMSQNIVEVASTVGLAYNMFGVYNVDPNMSSIAHAFGRFRPSRAQVTEYTTPEIGLRGTFTKANEKFGDVLAVEVLYGVKAIRSEWLGTIATQN